nr:protein kinase [Streptomyces sp. 846.5]
MRDEDGTLAVVSVLDTELVSDSGFQSAYPAEAAALAGLEERRVAPPERYVVDAMGRVISVVRRFFDSTPLSTLLAQRPRGLDPQTAAAVLNDVLTALCALHQQGVPHRKVRADQVLVGTDGVCVLVNVGLTPRIRAGSTGLTSIMQNSAADEATSTREREAAMAGDLSAAADLFAACLAPGLLLGALLPPRKGTQRPDGAPDSVPDRLIAVLARAKYPDPHGHCTAAELLAAFTTATRAFDSGWDERCRERLAALVQDNREAPTASTEVLRVRRSRRLPLDHHRRSRRLLAEQPPERPASRHTLTHSADALRQVHLRARAAALRTTHRTERTTHRGEQQGPKHPGAADRSWIRAVILYAAMLAVVIAGMIGIALSGEGSAPTRKASPPAGRPPAAPSLQPPGSVIGSATALGSAPAAATATATAKPTVSASHVAARPPVSVTTSPASATSSAPPQQGFLFAQGSIDPHSNPYWAQSNLVLKNDLAITALDVRLRVVLTPGVANTGSWATVPAQDLVTTVTRSDNALLYEFVLKPGVVMAPGSYEFAAQYNHAQGYRDSGNDSFDATATSVGNQVELTGSFDGTEHGTFVFRGGNSTVSDGGGRTTSQPPASGGSHTGGRRAVAVALVTSPVTPGRVTPADLLVNRVLRSAAAPLTLRQFAMTLLPDKLNLCSLGESIEPSGPQGSAVARLTRHPHAASPENGRVTLRVRQSWSFPCLMSSSTSS